MTDKITSEQLKVVIFSLQRPNGGGIDMFIKEHSVELGNLLESLVLPVIEHREYIASLNNVTRLADTYEGYDDEEEPEERIWDGCD